MPGGEPIPAAQYLRMSTDTQQFSLSVQARAIQRYASSSGFEVVKTYQDPGRSGLTLKHREGLGQLLRDVVSGSRAYKAILVYDVSRWGRFQDTDEAAHYEFICRSAGVPVHYCAETFLNDGTPPNAIMKTLKRVMAGEYSRELSVRCRRAKKILAENGWWGGGPAPYGLRRMLFALDGTPKQLLKDGQVKSLAAGRVGLVLGDRKEVSRVREIYRLVIFDKRNARSIAREFNSKGRKCCGRRWTYGQILSILRNPKYTGCATWGRTTGILGDKRVDSPREQWTLKRNAFAAIVDQDTFDAAQTVINNQTRNRSDSKLLDDLRTLLNVHGRLSTTIIDNAPEVPFSHTYASRFGSLRRAYDLIGYQVFENRAALWRTRRRYQKIKTDFFRQVLKASPRQVSVVYEKTRAHRMLRFNNGLKVAVVVCKWRPMRSGDFRWVVPVIASQKDYVTVLCLCNQDNATVKGYYLVPSVDRLHNFHIKEKDPWLKSGHQFSNPARLKSVLDLLSGNNRPQMAANNRGFGAACPLPPKGVRA